MSEKLTYEFTVDELNLILAGLSELPAKMSIELILRIKSQADASFQNHE